MATKSFLTTVSGLIQNESLPRIDHSIAILDQVFKLPPLTPELLRAINLIAPQFELTMSEKSRVFFEAACNGACWGEYHSLRDFFRSFKNPKKILEIGPGLGRSIIFFQKKLEWRNCELHLYEGEGTITRYTILGPRFSDSFCGNFRMLNCILGYNNMQDIVIHNANKKTLGTLEHRYDLIYSFYAVGLHWALEHFLDDILSLMHNTSVGIFTVPNEFEASKNLKKLAFKIVDMRTEWPKNGKLKLLLIAKQRTSFF